MKYVAGTSVVLAAVFGFVFLAGGPGTVVGAEDAEVSEHQAHQADRKAEATHAGPHGHMMKSIQEKILELREVSGEEQEELIDELVQKVDRAREKHSQMKNKAEEKHGAHGMHEKMKGKGHGMMHKHNMDMEKMKQNCSGW